eukprot:gene2994-biopygen12659
MLDPKYSGCGETTVEKLPHQASVKARREGRRRRAAPRPRLRPLPRAPPPACPELDMEPRRRPPQPEDPLPEDLQPEHPQPRESAAPGSAARGSAARGSAVRGSAARGSAGRGSAARGSADPRAADARPGKLLPPAGIAAACGLRPAACGLEGRHGWRWPACPGSPARATLAALCGPGRPLGGPGRPWEVSPARWESRLSAQKRQVRSRDGSTLSDRPY